MARLKFRQWDCELVERTYAHNKRKRWDLVDPITDELIAVATVNLPDVKDPGLDTGTHVLIKDWSENKGMVSTLLDAGLITGVEARIPTGYVYAALCKVKQ